MSHWKYNNDLRKQFNNDLMFNNDLRKWFKDDLRKGGPESPENVVSSGAQPLQEVVFKSLIFQTVLIFTLEFLASLGKV